MKASTRTEPLSITLRYITFCYAFFRFAATVPCSAEAFWALPMACPTRVAHNPVVSRVKMLRLAMVS